VLVEAVLLRKTLGKFSVKDENSGLKESHIYGCLHGGGFGVVSMSWSILLGYLSVRHSTRILGISI